MAKPQHQADVLDPPDSYYAQAANGKYIPQRATHRKDIHAEVRNTGEDQELRIIVTHRKHWLFYVGCSMAACLVGLMFWQYTIVPAWTHYQEQLACGSTHVCMTTVVVSPGKTRTFVSLMYDARIMVYEMPDAENTDGHTYISPTLYTGVDWHTITPHLAAIDTTHDGHLDIVISSPDFQGANPVLYNQGDGTFNWQQKG